MGCCSSRDFIVNENIPGQDSIAVETFQLLELSESDINCFWKAFIDMDADDSGTIRADEFFAYFHIENTVLNTKIFMTMDSDHSGYLNFCEFVCAMWNFLGMDPNFLGALAFYIFDSDGTNSLEYAEIKNLVETIHHKSDKNTAVKKLIESIMHNHSTVSVDYFTKCCQEMQSLCAPLIGMQQSLREQIVGARFWVDLAAKRGLDPIRSRPNYIKTIAESIAEKNLQKKIAEIEKRRQDQDAERAEAIQKKKHTSSTTGRRRSSLLFEYFATPDKVNQHPHHPPGHLPQKARARRSSITLLKPSLLKEEPHFKSKTSKNKPHGNQVQPDFNDIGQSGQENSESSFLVKPAISNLNLNFVSDGNDTDPNAQSNGNLSSPDPHHHKHKGNGTPNSHNHSDKSTKSRLHKAESADNHNSSNNNNNNNNNSNNNIKPSKSHIPKSESLGDNGSHIKSTKSKLSKTESSDTHHHQESKENKSSTKRNAHPKRSDSNNNDQQSTKKSTKS